MSNKLAGYVYDDAGVPVAGATVELKTTGDTTVNSGVTDSNGYWERTPPDSDVYDVRISHQSIVRRIKGLSRHLLRGLRLTSGSNALSSSDPALTGYQKWDGGPGPGTRSFTFGSVTIDTVNESNIDKAASAVLQFLKGATSLVKLDLNGLLTAQSIRSENGLEVAAGTVSVPNDSIAAVAVASGYPTSKLSGTVADSQIAGVSASKLTGQIQDGQIAGISGSKVSGAVASATNATNATNAGNANTVGGYGPGNGNGNIPISNGAVNANLNSDLLDGVHAVALARSRGDDTYLVQGGYVDTGSTDGAGTYTVTFTTAYRASTTPAVVVSSFYGGNLRALDLNWVNNTQFQVGWGFNGDSVRIKFTWIAIGVV